MRTYAIALVLVMAGCNANLPEGKLSCTNDKSCPSDWMCLSGVGKSDHCFSSVKARDKVVMEGKGGSGKDGGPSDDGGPGRDGGPREDGGPGRDGSVNGDPCATNNGGCDPLVACSGSGAEPTCGACPSGYSDETGDGTRCTDIDECATDNGDCGDPSEYACSNNDGAAPTCRLIELDCFNGEDDNDDGLVDCADPDCGAGAVCVEKRAGFNVGVVVEATESCPSGTTETLIHQGLSSGSVCDEGCTCQADPVGCALDVFVFDDVTNCGFNAGGTLIKTVTSEICDSNNPLFGTFYGFRTGPMQVTQSCTVGGSPTGLPPTVWAKAQKFCATASVAGGCEGTQVCVAHAPSPERQCALSAGAGACTGYTEEQKDWYTAAKDTRTCGSCGCNPKGGTCDGASLSLTESYTCNAWRLLSESSEICDYQYSAPATLTIGNRKDPTCTAFAPITGSLTATGRRTLCCKPE